MDPFASSRGGNTPGSRRHMTMDHDQELLVRIFSTWRILQQGINDYTRTLPLPIRSYIFTNNDVSLLSIWIKERTNTHCRSRPQFSDPMRRTASARPETVPVRNVLLAIRQPMSICDFYIHNIFKVGKGRESWLQQLVSWDELLIPYLINPRHQSRSNSFRNGEFSSLPGFGLTCMDQSIWELGVGSLSLKRSRLHVVCGRRYQCGLSLIFELE